MDLFEIAGKGKGVLIERRDIKVRISPGGSLAFIMGIRTNFNGAVCALVGKEHSALFPSGPFKFPIRAGRRSKLADRWTGSAYGKRNCDS